MRRLALILSCWLPPLLWCSLIFYLSSIPGLNSGWGIWDLIFRKIAHMAEYGILVALVARALTNTWTALAPAGAIGLAAAFSFLYAISDEIHQAFVPNRGPSASDVAVDTVGIVIAVWIARRFFRLKEERVLASMKKLVVIIIVAGVLAGCGPDAAFKRARGAEAKGRAYEAWQKYQAFAARFPDDKNAAEAVFRAGWLAQNELADCGVALAFYDRVGQKYPGSDPWAGAAAFHAQNCPDYFPLVPKMSWVEGDSDTGGRNARIESACQVSSTSARLPFSTGLLSRSYFAGTNKFKTIDVLYRKEGATVWEHPAGGETPRMVLKAPLEEGARWTAQAGGRTYKYEILSTTRTVTVSAGTFERCLLVQGRAEGVPGGTNEYYAPSVGRILTSFSTDAGERRNIELLSYQPGDTAGGYK